MNQPAVTRPVPHDSGELAVWGDHSDRRGSGSRSGPAWDEPPGAAGRIDDLVPAPRVRAPGDQPGRRPLGVERAGGDPQPATRADVIDRTAVLDQEIAAAIGYCLDGRGPRERDRAAGAAAVERRQR